MQSLNFPSFEPKLIHQDGETRIFDKVRGKYVLLTAEEWVRQHVLYYLIHKLSYPKGLIKVESGVAYNSRIKRSDIVVYTNKAKPYILVECKAPEVAISQATLEQAAMYNKTLQAPIIMLTNGLTHYSFMLDEQGQPTSLEHLPAYTV